MAKFLAGMGRRSVELTDDLEAAIRKEIGGRSMNAWIREACAEKLGRSQVRDEIAELRDRVERLERVSGQRQPPRGAQ